MRRWTVNLPWFSRDMAPNARPHFQAKARAAKKDRKAGFEAALEANARKIGAAGLRVTLEFSPPSRAGYDHDNLVASCKALLDGIADATGVNDNRFVLNAPVVLEHGTRAGITAFLEEIP